MIGEMKSYTISGVDKLETWTICWFYLILFDIVVLMLTRVVNVSTNEKQFVLVLSCAHRHHGCQYKCVGRTMFFPYVKSAYEIIFFTFFLIKSELFFLRRFKMMSKIK